MNETVEESKLHLNLKNIKIANRENDIWS